MDNKLRFRIQLLSLLSMFFIYKAIDASFSKNTNEVMLWSLITVVYAISLTIMYFVIKNWQKEAKISNK